MRTGRESDGGAAVNRSYFIFDEATGMVMGVASVSDRSAAGWNAPGQSLIPGTGAPDDYYVQDPSGTPQLQEKLDMPATVSRTDIAADGVEVVSISNLPPGTLIYTPQGLADAPGEDGVFEWGTTLPGEYVLLLEHLQYKPFEVIINAD